MMMIAPVVMPLPGDHQIRRRHRLSLDAKR
jgi:hypothetical protein